MTTIAADVVAGVMCSDSKWCDDDVIGVAKKVWRVKGDLIGGAGDMDELQAFVALYKTGGRLVGKSLSILRLSPAGLAMWSVSGDWVPVIEPRFAIGSGAGAARGAMAYGATCAQAVRAACAIDANTRGPVRTYKLRAAA